jgi:hypothetical protein
VAGAWGTGRGGPRQREGAGGLPRRRRRRRRRGGARRDTEGAVRSLPGSQIAGSPGTPEACSRKPNKSNHPLATWFCSIVNHGH